MVNIAVDVETRGLNTQNFIIGCAIKEGSQEEKYFYKKEDLWNYLLEQGHKAKKRNKNLNVYSHNAQYDFYSYAPLFDKNIKWFCHRPFIVSYNENNKELIKFLDTMNIYRMSLASAGELVGYNKMETPEFLKSETHIPTKKEIESIKPYLKRDTEIVLKLIQYIKDKCKQNGINIRRFYTINQIAINNLMNVWKNSKTSEDIFSNSNISKAYDTYRAKEIHSAYRGGRVEVFKEGTFKNCMYIDCNSLYPYSATKIKFPKLRTERLYKNPIKMIGLDNILYRISVSKACLEKKNESMGCIPIRTNNGNYFPQNKCIIIGTYTNYELAEAVMEGYKIIDIEWSVIWQEADVNPFKKIFKDLYTKRGHSKNTFDSFFFKSMMNCAIGKLAQTKTNKIYQWDTVESAEEYLNQKYKIINRKGYNYLYTKEDSNQPKKKYYMPIIPTLINAYARIYMYKQLKKIPSNDLIYTDTDSILATGNHLNKYKISKNMGNFKIVFINKEIITYGKKTLLAGNEIKIAGFRKKGLSKEEFKQGNIKNKKMITILNFSDPSKIGTFKEEERDLNKLKEESITYKEEMGKQNLFIDNNEENIDFFLPKIRKEVILSSKDL